ncbi:hypothetical protein N7530_011433 [Penicillium desertorum]|uniref:GED domain-containing protein n=1 Tax=Penicillium desertorum TaxID=1303715 RepID=A0A9W9WHB8_9EURO|nr:hypothetical protein N7530_011433 [Penicillium desertorum]
MGRPRHFAGVESSEQLAFIDELQALGLSSTVNLPELVVVGDQSAGKSSVLQAITEVSFPVKDGTCTRFPIQISFRQSSAATEFPVKATIVPGGQSENDEALLARIRDFSVERVELTTDVIKEIMDQATECIFGTDQPGKRVSLSDATLRIERKEQVLNGANGDGPEDTSMRMNAAVASDLARRYLANDRNIVLVVIDDVDVERLRIFELMEEIPGLEERCIGVLNKCDRKQEGSDEWMVKLLRNDLPTVPHLDHGWFGLRSRVPNEAHITDAERDERESAEFMKKDWQEVAKDRTGIQALMKYVDKERRAQIQSSIPHIIAEIRQRLRECKSDLSRMGEVRDSPKAQRYFVLQFCHEMQRMAEATLRGQYQVVPSEDPRIRLRYEVHRRLDQFYMEIADHRHMQLPFSNYEQDLINLSSMSRDPREWDRAVQNGSGLYAEIHKEAKISEGRSLPGTVHPDVEEKIFRKQSSHWGGIASRFVDDVKDLVKSCHDVLIRIAIPNSKVRLEVSRIMAKTLEEWHKQADMALSDLLEDNQARPLMTRNPQLLAETTYADQSRGEILGKMSSQGSSTDADQNGDVKHNPKGNGDHPRFISTNLSQVLFVRARLESYYTIALYRFIDNVAMQVVERHILGPRCPMLTVSVETFARLDDEELGAIAGEDQSEARMRARLERLQSRYTEALEKWERLRVL